MKDIAIYGAGGLGREVACLINKINQVKGSTWNIIGFFDDGKEIGALVSHFGQILGGCEELNNWPNELSVVLGFGNPKTIKVIREKLSNHKLFFPNIIDPDFSVGDPITFSIGEGNIIKRQCAVTTSVTIGCYNLLNGYNSIGHDVCIGDFNVIMPGARISGEVVIGNNNLIGADSFIKQQIKIKDGVVLSPLSALLTKPKENCTYIGNPAKLFKY